MKSGKIVVFVSLLVSVTAVAYVDESFIYDSPIDKIKDHPNKCYIEELGLFDNKDFVRAGKSCQMVKCLGNNKGQIEMKRCPPLAVEPPCYAEYPADKPFPECCTFEIKCLPTIPKPTRPPRV
ncbi:hypothetical protein WA026_007651 [Henosepilachna vigintioctopunctata]|uniref:Single domain-containing protein n=1 Tax=Henosepilachna vigintioctopunctata TaxID=420089 RepID=A0AAW1TYC8_9CUCU